MATQATPEALIWGHGPVLFEAFLEPTCPFSTKAFAKLFELLEQMGEDKVTIRLWLHSQPWHMYSGVITRAILAATTLPDGKEQARRMLAAVAAHREEFEFTDHATGPNRQATPDDILDRLKSYSGVDMLSAFDEPDLQKLVKLHTRYARQNGIHVSPTFMVNGVVDPTIGSGDTIESWQEKLEAAA